MRAGVAGRLGFDTPPAGPGVCTRCHGPLRDGRAECWCCRAVARALGAPPGLDRVVVPVVPVAVCGPGDPLHLVLRGYKDAVAVSARRHFAHQLAVHLDLFLAVHGDCVRRAARGGWDCVAIVPSSGGVPGDACGGGDAARPAAAHPLAAVVDAVPALAGLSRLGLRRGTGCGHLAPDARAFTVSGAAPGRRVLLLDDTWVTGARMASAAAALEAAGAAVVAMVVSGRFVGMRPSTRRWWDRVAAIDAAIDADLGGVDPGGRCCLVHCEGYPSPVVADARQFPGEIGARRGYGWRRATSTVGRVVERDPLLSRRP